MRSPLAILMSSLMLAALPALAQTPPTPDITFISPGPAPWSANGNWSPERLPTTADDVLIGDNNTVTMTNSDGSSFGTLTLGVDSRINLSASNNSGLKASADVYLNGGSTLHWVTGHSRTSSSQFPNYCVVPSGTTPATISLGSGAGEFTGNLHGSGDLDVVMQRNARTRLNASNFSGNLTYKSNNSTFRQLEFGRYAGSNQSSGSGTMTAGNHVYVNQASTDAINDSGTLHLINPLFPALRSGPTAGSGAYPKSKFLAAGEAMDKLRGQTSKIHSRRRGSKALVLGHLAPAEPLSRPNLHKTATPSSPQSPDTSLPTNSTTPTRLDTPRQHTETQRQGSDRFQPPSIQHRRVRPGLLARQRLFFGGSRCGVKAAATSSMASVIRVEGRYSESLPAARAVCHLG